jgi:hypothetical protein
MSYLSFSIVVQDAPYLRDVVVLETMEDMDKVRHKKGNPV